MAEETTDRLSGIGGSEVPMPPRMSPQSTGPLGLLNIESFDDHLRLALQLSQSSGETA
jgi:hypothetical protein